MKQEQENKNLIPLVDIAEQLSTAFEVFTNKKALSGLLLIITSLVALFWVNFIGHHSYEALWHTAISFGAGDFLLEKPLHVWINDGLMALFFFYVGLEIKREVMVGELSEPGEVILPIFAAIGGMAIPGLLFVALSWGQPGVQGWGIPMATDIAFSLGILMLLGKRVPVGLKIFLTAFAIVDDLGAVLVIALFYSKGTNFDMLLIASGIYGLMWMLNAFNVRRMSFYSLGALGMWYFVLQSGIHPTVAGVMAATAIPANIRLKTSTFVQKTKGALNNFLDANSNAIKQFLTNKQLQAIDEVETNVGLVQPPLQRLEYALDDYVSLLIMPLFALANAGIVLSGGEGAISFDALSFDITFSLVIGKVVGIFAFSALAIFLHWASLPKNTTWIQLLGVSFLGGVGFTMALFIANLAYQENELLGSAKLGILIGSLIAGLVGIIILRISLIRKNTADD